MQYYCTAIECLRFKRLTSPSAKEDVETELPCKASGNVKWYDHFRKQFGRFLKHETYHLPCAQPFHSSIFT